MSTRKQAGEFRLGEFGRLVRRYRKDRGLTVNQLARRLDMDQGYLSKIERGLRPPPEIIPHFPRIVEGVEDSARFLRVSATAQCGYFGADGETPEEP